MKKIKNIGNYYGGLWIQEFENKYYWIIENHDTDFSILSEWSEITKSLYQELLWEKEI
ncbi:hypothetical protein ACFX5D_16195 [Flavobacterium sp. LB3P45]|uniref:Uncharacterized protein n=1 Tax=Flavobacterium fructosi TaxID=3230416 RepID=A0ABW6HR16_9FLAO